MCPRRVKHPTPAPQLLDRHVVQLELERGTLCGIDVGRGEEGLDESFDVESRPADNNRPAFGPRRALDPFVGIACPSRGGVALDWLDDIDPVMRDLRALLGGRFCGPDVEVTVNLARV